MRETLSIMPTDYLIIDAFTDTAFSGNPAAVVPLKRPAEAAWMQQVANEFNLAETAFLHPDAADRSTWHLRWFTPTVEVSLCGHATLASAAALWRLKLAPAAPIRFLTKSGALFADADGGRIVLDFPAVPCTETAVRADLAAALGVPVLRCGANSMDLLAEVADAETVKKLRPDLAALKTLQVRGIMVTAVGDAGSGFDIVSRFFAPSAGIDEDPVTGSAHCALMPWWVPRIGRDRLVCRQLSARGGTLHCHLRGDRVDLGGTAVVVAEGRLLSDPQ
jgi:PhzF family phenazine biosynthesis protein